MDLAGTTSQVGHEIITWSQHSAKDTTGWSLGAERSFHPCVPYLPTQKEGPKEFLKEEIGRKPEVAGAKVNRKGKAGLEKSPRCPYLLTLRSSHQWWSSRCKGRKRVASVEMCRVCKYGRVTTTNPAPCVLPMGRRHVPPPSMTGKIPTSTSPFFDHWWRSDIHLVSSGAKCPVQFWAPLAMLHVEVPHTQDTCTGTLEVGLG